MAIEETVMQISLKVEEKERIKQGATLTGVNQAQFVLRAALMEAQHILADRTRLAPGGDRYNAFMDALGKSPERNDALNTLLHTEAPWD